MTMFSKHLLAKLYGGYFNTLAYLSEELAAEKSFKTFSKVRKGKALPFQQDFLDSARKDRILARDHELQSYHWPGSGKTVLLVHGWESNSFRWQKLQQQLSGAKFNCIAFDAPAHGYSSGTYLHVPLYAECLQVMIEKYDPDYVVAHSMGAMTTLYNQYLYPKKSIRKIVTIGAPSELHEIMAHYQKLLGLSDKTIQAIDRYVQQQFGFTIQDFSTSRFVETNLSKGLLLHDRLDSIAPFHAAAQVHERWKNSLLVATEGLGHSMQQDGVNHQIVNFLKS